MKEIKLWLVKTAAPFCGTDQYDYSEKDPIDKIFEEEAYEIDRRFPDKIELL